MADGRTVKLEPTQWRKILAFLREQPNLYIGKPRDCRRFVEAVLWILRSGAAWRLLPPDYGNWNSIYKRYNRWSEHGIWQKMFEHFAQDPDMEKLIIDSTVIRAHPCAAGYPRAKGGRNNKHSDAAGVASAARFTSA